MKQPEEAWTVEDVYDALEECPETSDMKELLTRFDEATNDWPTMNLKYVDQFLKEFNEYIENPKTADDIRRKNHFNGGNAWNAEAAENIALMLEASTRAFGEEDFDTVISRLKEYVNRNKQRHANTNYKNRA
jgi:hypothetical protein